MSELEDLFIEIPELSSVDEMIKGLCDGTPDELAIGRLLVYSAFVGENDIELAHACELPIEIVFQHAKTLIEAHVFGRSQAAHYQDYFQNKDSGIVLTCDLVCARGHLQRGENSTDAVPTWKVTESGMRYVESNFGREPKP